MYQDYLEDLLDKIGHVRGDVRTSLINTRTNDLRAKRDLMPQQFKQRCSQLLNSYSVPKDGEQYSRLQKLVRGMPKRLRKCKANSYGRCGK